MPSNPLAKLTPKADKTAAAMLKALEAAQLSVKQRINETAAKAAAATSAYERDRLYARIATYYRLLSDGLDEQLKALVGEAEAVASKAAITDAGKRGVIRYDATRAQRYWEYVRPGTQQNLTAVFTDKMADSAIAQLRQAFLETYRQGALEGWTANQTHKAMQARWAELAGDDNGFRFVDRSGKPWENARYLQMLTRTTAQRVARDSYIDRLVDLGIKIARITDDGDVDCHICQAWEGLIVQIAGKSSTYPTWSEALAAGVGHPNCLHSLQYIDETLEADEIKRQKAAGKVDWSDLKAVQKRTDEIAMMAYRDDGMTPIEASRAVASDRFARAIRGGVFSDDAAEAARMLPDAVLDQAMKQGVPLFRLVKKGETPGWKQGSSGGVVRVPRGASAADVLAAITG